MTLDHCGETLSVVELAAVLGVSRATVDRQLRARCFPIPELPRIGPRRWSKAVVRAWLENNGRTRRAA